MEKEIAQVLKPQTSQPQENTTSLNDDETNKIIHALRTARLTKVGKRYEFCSFDNFNGFDTEKNNLKNVPFGEFCFIHGIAGCGKTHLSVAVLRELLIKNQPLRPENYDFTNLNEILLGIRSTFKKDSSTEESVINTYKNKTILIVDDIGVQKTTDYTIDIFYYIMDYRYSNCKTTILTSNLGLQEIAEQFTDRVASRLASGVVVKIDGEDYRLKEKGL